MEFSEGKRFALLIGNNNYQDKSLNDLRAPHHDVQLLKSILLDKRIGRFDEVEDLIDCDYNSLRESIERFFTGKKTEDLLLFYFSGHGMVDEGNDLCLICNETKVSALHATSLHASFIKRQMARSKAKKQILLLDCCFGGAFDGAVRSQQVKIAKYFIDSFKPSISNISDKHVETQGQVVVTASSTFEFAYEDGEFHSGHSPHQSWFTRSLIEGIQTGLADKDQDGLIEIQELFEFINDKLQGSPQTPTYTATELQGIIWIANNPNSSIRLQSIEKSLYKEHDIRNILRVLWDLEWSRLEDYEVAFRISKLLKSYIEATDDNDDLKLYRLAWSELKEPLEKLAEQREQNGRLDDVIELMEMLQAIDPQNDTYEIKIRAIQKQQSYFNKYQKACQYFNEKEYEQAIRIFADIVYEDPHYEDAAEKLYLSVMNSLPNGGAPSVKLEEPVNESSTMNRIKVRIIFSVLLISIFVQIFLTILLYTDVSNKYNILISFPIIISYIFCIFTTLIALGWIILQGLQNHEK